MKIGTVLGYDMYLRRCNSQDDINDNIFVFIIGWDKINDTINLAYYPTSNTIMFYSHSNDGINALKQFDTEFLELLLLECFKAARKQKWIR